MTSLAMNRLNADAARHVRQGGRRWSLDAVYGNVAEDVGRLRQNAFPLLG